MIASLGIGRNAEVFNINADTTAATIAKELNADALFLATKVGALFRDLSDRSSRIKQLDAHQSEKFIEAGVINDGMIPKVQEALAVVNDGVSVVAVCNAAVTGCFLSLIDEKDNYGTRFLAD